MQLLVCASWDDCPKNPTGKHFGEFIVLDGTEKRIRAAMNQPLDIWKKRKFTCEHCGQSADVQPTGTYLTGSQEDRQDG